jgi:hypothetical protein
VNVLLEEQLMEMTGYKRRSDLFRHLEEEGFDVHAGKGGRVYVILLPSETPNDELSAV